MTDHFQCVHPVRYALTEPEILASSEPHPAEKQPSSPNFATLTHEVQFQTCDQHPQGATKNQ